MESTITTKSAGVKNGVILALILIIYSLILQLTENAGNQTLGYVSYVFIIGVIFWGMKQFKDANEGFMSFGDGFKIGMWISAISGVVNSIFLYVYLSFVDDSMLAAIKEQQVVELEKQGMTDAQIDQALSYSEMFMTPTMMLVFGIVGAIIGGLIISAIVSAIMKKDKPVFDNTLD